MKNIADARGEQMLLINEMEAGMLYHVALTYLKTTKFDPTDEASWSEVTFLKDLTTKLAQYLDGEGPAATP